MGETKSAGEIERLLEEYVSLSRRQYDSLQTARYARLSRSEAAAYDAIVLRIKEISQEIVRLRSEGS